MASVTKEKRSFSPMRMLDHMGAYAFTGISLFSAIGTGVPVIQMAAAALLPGAHMGVRATLRSITGTPQKPMGRLTRIYSVGAASLMTPLVNFPDIAQGLAQGSPLVIATGVAGGLGMAYAATVATSEKSLSGQSWLKDLDKDLEKGPSAEGPGRDMESIFDLSADKRAEGKVMAARPSEPAASLAVRKPARGAVLGAAKLQPAPPKLKTASATSLSTEMAKGLDEIVMTEGVPSTSPTMDSLRSAIAMDILDSAFGARDAKHSDLRPASEHGSPR